MYQPKYIHSHPHYTNIQLRLSDLCKSWLLKTESALVTFAISISVPPQAY